VPRRQLTEALPGLREDRGLAACLLVAADNHIDVKRVDLESAADAAEGSGRGVTVSGLMAVGPSYTSSSAAPGVTHMAHPTSHRPMSLIILFSYSSHLVQTMTCGGASWVSFGMGSERRSARQLIELSNRGGVIL
jgi:hypothetical protein